MRPIPTYKAGLYGLTETRQLSNSNATPAFIPVHRTGFSAYLNKRGEAHVGEFLSLLLKKDGEQKTELEEGKKEVEELLG